MMVEEEVVVEEVVVANNVCSVYLSSSFMSLSLFLNLESITILYIFTLGTFRARGSNSGFPQHMIQSVCLSVRLSVSLSVYLSVCPFDFDPSSTNVSSL